MTSLLTEKVPTNASMNSKASLILRLKNLLKLKRRNLTERLIMLQTKNGLTKSVDLKDTSLEN
jgi:hypothetical protein